MREWKEGRKDKREDGRVDRMEDGRVDGKVQSTTLYTVRFQLCFDVTHTSKFNY